MNRIDAVRRFNRFYTQRVGALHTGFVGSPFPLPQAAFRMRPRGQSLSP